MPIQEYLNFDLQVGRVGEAFRARVIQSPVGEAPAEQFDWPFGEREREDVMREVFGMLALRGAEPTQTEKLKTLGARLFDAVFHGQVQSLFEASRARLQPHQGLRVRLRLGDASKLPAMRRIKRSFLWSFLQRRYVARDGALHFVALDGQPAPQAMPVKVLGSPLAWLPRVNAVAMPRIPPGSRSTPGIRRRAPSAFTSRTTTCTWPRTTGSPCRGSRSMAAGGSST